MRGGRITEFCISSVYWNLGIYYCIRSVYWKKINATSKQIA